MSIILSNSIVVDIIMWTNKMESIVHHMYNPLYGQGVRDYLCKKNPILGKIFYLEVDVV
jgi:hypothetical protein